MDACLKSIVSRLTLKAVSILSSDPFSSSSMGFGAGDVNLYRYCGGDPVNWIDPSGLSTSSSTKNNDGYDSGDNTFTGDGIQWGGWGTFGNGDNTPVYVSPNGEVSMDPQYVSANGTGAFGDAYESGFDRTAGSYAGDRAGGAGSPGDGGGERYSGAFTIKWWPKSLTLPYTSPATPEQIAWTNRGRTPTLVVTGILALPVIGPASGAALLEGGTAYAVAGWNGLVNGVETVTLTGIGAAIVGYQSLMANPAVIEHTGEFIQGMSRSSWDATTPYEGAGHVAAFLIWGD
jgi:hypothetical protein